MTYTNFHSFKMPMLGLANSDVDVWLTTLDRWSRSFTFLSRMLSEDECSRAKSFYFAADRRSFIIRRALLRNILGLYLGTDPGKIQFSYGPYGKPYLSQEWGRDIQFNLSQSHGLTMYAIARNRRIGIDLEVIRDLPDIDHMAACFFSSEENTYLRQLSPDIKRQRFFCGWACKEAFLKATGEGLTYPLNQVGIDLETEGSPQFLNPETTAKVSPWSFRVLSPTPNSVAALAVEGHEYNMQCRLWQPLP